MDERECKEIYEYLLARLRELEVENGIISKVEALKYEKVINEQKIKSSKTRNKSKYTNLEPQRMSSFDNDEIAEPGELRMLTDKERLLRALEILRTYTVSIPLMPQKIRENLGINPEDKIVWMVENDETDKEDVLGKLGYLDSNVIEENQNIFDTIVKEVLIDGKGG